MKKFDQLNKLQLRELINKGWMTHDGMWFYNCLQECGIDKTNKINKEAVRMMAMIEIKRIKKTLCLPDVHKFEDLKTLLEEGFEVIRADFMDFNFHFPAKNVFVWEIPTCFAYEGIKQMGVIDQYQCGIIDRVLGWLDALDVKYTYTPQEDGCLLHKTGKCVREFKFHF